MKQSMHVWKKLAFALAAALLITALPAGSGDAQAASKTKLATTSKLMKVGSKETLKVKNLPTGKLYPIEWTR